MGTINIVVVDYPIIRSTSLINICREILKYHRINILCEVGKISEFPEDLRHFVVFRKEAQNSTLEKSGNDKKRIKKVLSFLFLYSITVYFINKVENLQYLYNLIRFSRWLKRNIKEGPVISIDKWALFPCLTSGIKVDIYYSLEACPLNECKDLKTYILALVEKIYLKYSRPALISQSINRIALIDRKFKLKYFLLPATSNGEILHKNNFLRTLLNIPINKKIVLMAGGLGPDQHTREIIDTVDLWDDNFFLVLHFADQSVANSFSKVLDNENLSGRIALTNIQLTLDQAQTMIFPSADIGIVYYKNLDSNYRNVAYSSGKLSDYLRCGVPVIVPDFGDFKSVIEIYKFGLISSVNDIPSKLMVLNDNLEFYQKNAYNAFNDVYCFKKYIDGFGKFIEEVITD